MANVRVTADAQGNTLIVVGPPAAMGLMAALIEQLDRLPASEAQIKVFTVRNGDATALAEMLTNLFGTPAAGAQGAQPGQGAATAGGDSAIVPLRFSVDQRTNSIIASGNAGDLNVIYAILTRLDEGDIRQRSTIVYRLKNAPAQDVANALTTLLAQQLALIQSSPELVTPVEAIERQVIVVAEPVTNSLIISATSRYFTEIQRIIGDLDRRPPMIVIQVCLAEVNLNDTEQFGVEWGLQDSLMFDRSLQTNRFNFNNAILPNDAGAASLATRENVATQGLANFALGRTDPTLGFGGLVLTASNESVSVLLRALEQSSRAQIISRPQVQTLDNIPAFVQVGAAVPRIQGALATGQVVTPLVNDINVGIVLNVTPRTSPDGTIVMQVYAEKSSVGPDATGIPVFTDAQGNVVRSPQIPKTLAQTTVSARSGQTVVLGGLITKELNETTRRVPYLGDIPLLGRLFRFDAVTNKRTELLVILTPYLIQTTEQMDWITSRESERMSWCVADIVNIHGPVPVSGNAAFNPGTPVIYPDLDPGAPPPVQLHPDLPQMPYPPFPPGPPLPPNFTMPAGVSETPTPAATPNTPTPAAPRVTPPPPQPGLQPPGPQPMGLSPPYPETPTGSVVVPQPASLLPNPGAAAPRGPMAPRPIEQAVPPAGTDPAYSARLPSAPILGMRPADAGQYPQTGSPPYVTPAVFQQPVAR